VDKREDPDGTRTMVGGTALTRAGGSAWRPPKRMVSALVVEAGADQAACLNHGEEAEKASEEAARCQCMGTAIRETGQRH